MQLYPSVEDVRTSLEGYPGESFVHLKNVFVNMSCFCRGHMQIITTFAECRFGHSVIIGMVNWWLICFFARLFIDLIIHPKHQCLTDCLIELAFDYLVTATYLFVMNISFVLQREALFPTASRQLRNNSGSTPTSSKFASTNSASYCCWSHCKRLYTPKLHLKFGLKLWESLVNT